MCGIAAIFSYNSNGPPVDGDELLAIRDRMIHRGPDGEGLWISEDRRIGLGHRRLAIVDLTDAGLQPMWNRSRTCAVIFNGEIYNYPGLRSGLESQGRHFLSHCDTEVLLHLYEEKGAEMVHDLRGMYAFAIWDAPRRTLFCARDPFGIKPFYYADNGKTIRLASQIKALLKGKDIDTSPEAAGHVGFFLWGSVPDPFTFYRGIKALPAGHTLTIAENERPVLHSFCSIPEILRDAEIAARQGLVGDRHMFELLHEAIRESAATHLMADVPVGLFLSGGLDSATLTALASEGNRDVRTLTLGFHEFRGGPADETDLAEVIARQYKTRHQTVRVTRRDFEAEALRIFDAMDRPSIDGVNAYLVSHVAARVGLKVAVSGLGGDELFAGYPSFTDVPRMVRIGKRVSPQVPTLARVFRVITQPMLKRFTSPKYTGLFEYGSDYPGAYLLRRSLFMPWELPRLLDPDLVREGWQQLNTLNELAAFCGPLESPRLKISALELCWYMRHQLLRDADWGGMAHSVEIRVPLIDLKLFREIAPLLASPHPPGKIDMALAPEIKLPPEVLSRPKTGFAVPVRDWLLRSFDPTRAGERGLRGWAREVYSRFADPTTMHARTLRSRRKRKGVKPVDNSNGSKALVLVTDAFGGFGGISRYNRDFLWALAKSDGIEEVLVVPRLMPRKPEEAPANMRTITEALGGKRRFLVALTRLAFALRRERPARLLIFCAHIHLLPAAAFVKLICGGTLHLTIYGVDAWKPLSDPFIRLSLRAIDGFIAIGRVTKRRFENWTHFRDDKGVLLFCAVDVDRFTPGPASPALNERYGLNGSTVLMTFGRLESKERYKGFDEVLGVLKAVQERVGPISYLICGDGPDRPRLIAKARRLGFEVMEPDAPPPARETRRDVPRVIFTGGVAERDKVEIYRLADLYVMPSAGEGFGIVFLEALACGVPVIGSKADGSRDALREGHLGTLVDPHDPDEILDAILQALSLPNKASALPDRSEIAFFSTERFQERVQKIVDAMRSS